MRRIKGCPVLPLVVPLSNKIVTRKLVLLIALGLGALGVSALLHALAVSKPENNRSPNMRRIKGCPVLPLVVPLSNKIVTRKLVPSTPLCKRLLVPEATMAPLALVPLLVLEAALLSWWY